MTPRPRSELRCPLCGAENSCAPAASGSFETPCWCSTVDFPPELLETLAAADRGRSCLCARCAAGGRRLTGQAKVTDEDDGTPADRGPDHVPEEQR